MVEPLSLNLRVFTLKQVGVRNVGCISGNVTV